MVSLAMVDLDGNSYEIPPWTGTSEGAATVITAMIDPTIKGKSLLSKTSFETHS